VADRRALRSLWLVAVTLLLTACSTGVPPSGKVVVVSPVPPAPQPEQANGPGSGPRPGLSEAQVAQGFMRAMSTGDPERAAPWVVPDRSTQLQLQEWRSGRAVNVYTNEFQPQASSDDHGQKLIEVRVQRSGMLTDRRWVPDSRQITLRLRLRQVEGEWRVANPDSAPWIDDASFEQTYGPVDLFMVAPDHVHLAQMRVFLARPPSVRQQPIALQARAEATVRALLAGPEGRVARTLTTAIPSETRLLHFSYADSLATIDLSREFGSGVGDSGLLRVGQLVWTVTRLIPTASVRITVEGRPAVAIGPDDFNASGTWRWSAPQLSTLFSNLWPHGPGDPKKLAFTRNGELFTTELLPGARPTLLPYNTTGQKLAPTWASQGNRLAFLLVGEGDGQSLWIGSGDGRTVQPTGIRGQLSPPTWLPDASRLLVLRRIGTRVELLSVTPGVQGAQRLQLARMPGGLQPTVLRISPDGAFVLAVGSSSRAKFGDSGVLFLGLLAPQGVVDWFPRPIAAGLGDVYSPIWVDSATVAFIGRTGTKDDLGKLWLMDADGWDPTPLLNLDPASENAIDIGDQLTVDPTGNQFVFIEQSEEGTSLWVVDRLGVGLRQLTWPGVNSFDSDPSFATR
jgi:Sporulation and spore germination